MIEVILGDKYTPEWEGVPSHMASGDFPIWERFRKLRGGGYDVFYYDVALAADLLVGGDVPENLQRMARWNAAKRIDALGVTDERVEIFEVRVSAAAGALGTILTYVDLWNQAPAINLPVQATILTDRADPDLKRLAGQHNIRVLEF